MKSGIVLSLAMAAALPLVADTTTANVVGLIRVDSSAKETIVSIPFVATSASADDAAIPVTDIVKTANLEIGDKLEYYNSAQGKYEVWQIVAGEGGVKTWQAATSVNDGEMTVASSSLARGNAIVLVRENPGSSFYLQGQVAKSASVECTMAQGSATAPAYSLIAPPTDTCEGVTLNDGTWSGVGAGDYVLVNGEMFKYDSSQGKWGRETYQNFVRSFVVTTKKIPLGQGAWYVSAKGATSAAKVTWTNLPSVGAN